MNCLKAYSYGFGKRGGCKRCAANHPAGTRGSNPIILGKGPWHIQPEVAHVRTEMSHAGFAVGTYTARVNRVRGNSISDVKSFDGRSHCGNGSRSLMPENDGKRCTEDPRAKLIHIGRANHRSTGADKQLIRSRSRNLRLDKTQLSDTLKLKRFHHGSTG